VSATGGSFSPDKCELQKVTPGAPCGEPGEPEPCPPEYRLVLEDENAEVSDDAIQNVRLTSLSAFGDGIQDATMRMDRDGDIWEFNGTLTFSTGKTRNLASGEISVDESGGSLTVDFDLVFDGGTGVKGSGEVPVVEVAES
jgi:hypothetical protein